MPTPSIIDLLVAASNRAAVNLPQVLHTDTSRFPIVTTEETRKFLDAQAHAMGTSLAGLCGTIVNEVVAETRRRANLKKS